MAIERGQQAGEEQRLVGLTPQPLPQEARFAKSVAQLAKVARAAPAHRDPAQRPANVRQCAQSATQLVAQPRIVMEQLHQPQPRVDQAHIHQRRRQILRQQPRPRPRHGAIDRAQQAARPRAIHRRDNFQALARRRIDGDMATARLAQGWRKEGQCPLARMVEIADQPAHRRQFGAAELTKPVQRRDPEQPFERGFGAAAGKGGAIKHMRVGYVERRPFRHHRLAGAQAGEFGGQIGGPAGHRFEPASRDVGGGQADLALSAHLRQRDKHVVATGIEQCFLGQRARRHIADNVARHERLAAARLGLRRRFGLFGDGDPVARLDQPGQIAFRAVHRHAAHRDRHPAMFAPTGQRNVERRGRCLRIVEEKFEEIPHAVEEQAVIRLSLERQILRHHGRRGGLDRDVVRGAGHEARIAPSCTAGKKPSRTCPQGALAARADATDSKGRMSDDRQVECGIFRARGAVFPFDRTPRQDRDHRVQTHGDPARPVAGLFPRRCGARAGHRSGRRHRL